MGETWMNEAPGTMAADLAHRNAKEALAASWIYVRCAETICENCENLCENAKPGFRTAVPRQSGQSERHA